MFLKFSSRHKAPYHIQVLSFSLKYAMSLLSCINTTLIHMPEASHSTLKAFVKSCKAKTDATQSLFFNKLKTLSCSSSYLNPTEFFIILVKGVIIVLKSFTNLL